MKNSGAKKDCIKHDFFIESALILYDVHATKSRSFHVKHTCIEIRP